jgi:3-oxoacyl-[acyl-carrier protein] reductase
VVNYAANRAKADEVVNEIREAGSEAAAIGVDISEVSKIEKLFAETIARFGKVDILVNNAGFMETALLEAVSEANFDKHFAINVKGTYFACQQAMKHMEPNGRIINFSTRSTVLRPAR